MKHLLTSCLLSLFLAMPSQAAWICNGCAAENIASIGDVTLQGAVSLKHISVLGNLTGDAGSSGSLTNVVVVGTPTLATNLTCDQVATTGTPAGTGTCSESWITLPSSPFVSATNLRLKPGTSLINNGVTVDGHTEDIVGRSMHGSAWDIGAYEFYIGSGLGSHGHGFTH